MRIDHIAIWTLNIEQLKCFYEKYFGAGSNKKYINTHKKFESYFLTLESGARIELMNSSSILLNRQNSKQILTGLAHFAISVGSKTLVDELTSQLKKDGHKIIGDPRETGDGYYESIVMDPDGNIIEITV